MALLSKILQNISQSHWTVTFMLGKSMRSLVSYHLRPRAQETYLLINLFVMELHGTWNHVVQPTFLSWGSVGSSGILDSRLFSCGIQGGPWDPPTMSASITSTLTIMWLMELSHVHHSFQLILPLSLTFEGI